MPTAATGDYELNWTSSTMNLTPYIGNSNVQLEFVYDDGGVWGYGAGIDDVVVSGTLASNPIQTAVNSGTGYSEEYLGPNETVHFYDDSRNIMCTIENLSAHDYGCTKVEVDRAGTGATGFANTSTNSFLHDKSFKVSPTTNNASGTYNITLYYTNAEVTGWEGATSESRTSTVMHKTNGTNNISDVTAGNPSSIPLDAATAIYATFGSNHTYTASFSTGFSGFGVGIADSPLPVELLSFTGEYLERKGNQLDWITVTEENTSHFDVERSTDGINFEFMGKVEAAGNSSERLTYDFLDTKPMNGVNYYRLRIVDLDQTFEYSNVISLKSIQGLDITMSPNPTKGDIFLSFNQEIRGTAQI
ncbi:MAG: hypothetical protein ACPG5P_08135, partial [Saprospiraceae bacterium]